MRIHLIDDDVNHSGQQTPAYNWLSQIQIMFTT